MSIFSLFVVTVRQKIAYNAAFSSIARVIDGVLALIVTAYLTRYLGPSGFGNYIIVFTFWYIFTVLADLGLYQITVREISQNKEKEPEIVNNAFTLRLSATVLVFFIGILSLFFLPYSHELKLGLILGAVGFWALSGGQVLVGVFQKNLRIDKIAIAEIAGRIVQLLLTLYVIEKDLGFLNVIAVFSASALINLTVICFFANKFVALRLAFDMAVWKRMIKEGWPLAVAAIFVMVYFRLNAIILSLMKGEEAVGVFGVGYKILENLIFFPTMFVGLVMPIMSQTAKNDLARFKEVIQKTFNALIVFLIPMVAFTVILSDKIVYAIGGENFSQSAGVLNILIFAAALIFLGTLWSNAIIALGAQRQLAKVYFFGAVVSIIANISLIHFFSYDGAAWATLLTEFLVTAMMALYLRQIIAYAPSAKKLSKVIIATLAASLLIIFIGNKVIFSSPFIALGALLSAGGIFYFLALFLLNGFNIKEIGSFLKK
ncbi:flippase [Patescibacteria group bacterium]|nr:flippase [Patescibacteria group bacterium]MBU4579578.1 flippase [Patescibacteria group bacterium]